MDRKKERQQYIETAEERQPYRDRQNQERERQRLRKEREDSSLGCK